MSGTQPEASGAGAQARPVGVEITCIDFSPEQVAVERVEDLTEFLARHRPAWSTVRWIDVQGLADVHAVHALSRKYELHPLAVEDIFSRTQRPKLDAYGGVGTGLNARLFITTRALDFRGGRLVATPLSIFLGHHTVLTFHAEPSDVFDGIGQRLASPGSRLRQNDASFLVYSLLDAMVDGCFPIIEQFDGSIEELETEVVERASNGTLLTIQDTKRQLTLLRWTVWPMREVVSALQRDPHECMSDTTKIYLADLYDHTVQVMEIVETYRERTGDLTESYRSSVSHRMNEVIKVLTVIGTIFIPLTFLAGVYGMNFRHLPELEWAWAYPAFWLVCLLLAGVMVALFRRRGWF